MRRIVGYWLCRHFSLSFSLHTFQIEKRDDEMVEKEKERNYKRGDWNFHSDHYAQMIHIWLQRHIYAYNGNELSLHDNTIIISVSFFIKCCIIISKK